MTQEHPEPPFVPDFELVLIIPEGGGVVSLTPVVAELGLPRTDDATREPKRFKRLREERERGEKAAD